jgi:hypothetical protein
MKKVTYYLKEERTYFDKESNENKKHYVPKTTVILFKHNNEISRGVAICSPLDIFSKEEGRKLAEIRAAVAWDEQKSYHKIRKEDMFINYETMKYKSEFNPTLTSYEKFLLEDPVDK